MQVVDDEKFWKSLQRSVLFRVRRVGGFCPDTFHVELRLNFTTYFPLFYGDINEKIIAPLLLHL